MVSHTMGIWVRSRNCSCLVTWFCYQLIAKPGNKTATVPWPDGSISIGLRHAYMPLAIHVYAMINLQDIPICWPPFIAVCFPVAIPLARWALPSWMWVQLPNGWMLAILQMKQRSITWQAWKYQRPLISLWNTQNFGDDIKYLAKGLCTVDLPIYFG